MSETRPAPVFDPLAFERLAPAESVARAERFRDALKTRRTVRDFAAEIPPRAAMEAAIAAAATAPSGANMQPWHFAVVTDPQTKRRIREAAEEEERAFYGGRAGDDWLDALAHLGTDAQKPFLETAPYLIVVFQQNYGIDPRGERFKHYYVQESVGIATGMLIAGLHQAGIATLTHTPSPMKFLGEILDRPKNERATMILVCGYPAETARVPRIDKKPFSEICSFR
jgi:nitroreductase